MTNTEPTPFQAYLARRQAGDPAACNELLRLTRDRLQAMTRKMMVRFARLRRWVESDDIVQKVTESLSRCLAQKSIPSSTDYLRLAAEHIRRELIDQARHYFGPQGSAKRLATPNRLLDGDPLNEVPAADQDDTALLDQVAELHEQVENLSPKLRDIVHFHYYLGMTQPEVAEVLAVSLKTVRRRLTEAKLVLKERLERPDRG